MRRALCLGSNGPNIESKLKFAVRDAHRLSRILKDKCDFDDVRRLKGGRDPFDLQREIAVAASELKKNDTLLFYFSGHGVVEGGRLYLLLAGTQLESMLATALPASAILDAMKECKANQRILILDCCNAGLVMRETGLKAGEQDRYLQNDLGFQSDAFDIILASEFLEKTKELPTLKSSALCEGIVSCLEAPMTTSDFDGDGAISTDDLMRWVEAFVSKLNIEDSTSGAGIPIPKRNGYSRGLNYITKPPKPKPQWQQVRINGSNEHRLIVLPIALGNSQELIVVSEAPTTVEQYKKFVDNVGHRRPMAKLFENGKWQGEIDVFADPHFGDPRNPIVGVDLGDAEAYCTWLSNRSKDANGDFRQYILPMPDILDYAELRSFPRFQTTNFDFEPPACGNLSFPLPILEAKRSALGLYSVSGNIWQWTAGFETWWDRLQTAGVKVEVKIVFGPYTEIFDQPEDELILYGGSFYDLETSDRKTFSVRSLTQQKGTRQADLGFRVCTTVAMKDLRDLDKNLEECVERKFQLGFYNEDSSATVGNLGEVVSVNWNDRPMWSFTSS